MPKRYFFNFSKNQVKCEDKIYAYRLRDALDVIHARYGFENIEKLVVKNF